jgi:hypothetical protein
MLLVSKYESRKASETPALHEVNGSPYHDPEIFCAKLL